MLLQSAHLQKPVTIFLNMMQNPGSPKWYSVRKLSQNASPLSLLNYLSLIFLIFSHKRQKYKKISIRIIKNPGGEEIREKKGSYDLITASHPLGPQLPRRTWFQTNINFYASKKTTWVLLHICQENLFSNWSPRHLNMSHLSVCIHLLAMLSFEIITTMSKRNWLSFWYKF